MSPPTAIDTTDSDIKSIPIAAPLDPGVSKHDAKSMTSIFPHPPKFTDKYEEREYLKGRLAAGFRIFGKYGFDEGVAGHITLRDPVEPDTFWVNPFGLAFSLIRKKDLIRVDHEGKVIDGGEVWDCYPNYRPCAVRGDSVISVLMLQWYS